MYAARCDDIPCLYNWMDASAHESEVKPIRGRPNCKPLGKRSKTHQTIRRGENDSLICRLYETDVVVYHKDGRIDINLNGWASQTTMNFIYNLLRVGIRQAHRRIWMQCVAVGKTETLGWYPVWVDGVNLFKRNGSGDLDLFNPFEVSRHRINRKGANNVREKFSAFRDYLHQTMKIRDNGFSTQEFGDVFGWVKHEHNANPVPNYPPYLNIRRSGSGRLNEFEELLRLAESTQLEDQYKASLYLARTAGMGFHSRGVWDAPLSAMLRLLDDVALRVYRDECFEKVQMLDGEIQRDPYLNFFLD